MLLSVICTHAKAAGMFFLMTVLLCFKHVGFLQAKMKVKTLYIFKMTAKARSIKMDVALKLSNVYVFNRDVCFCIVKKNDQCFL